MTTPADSLSTAANETLLRAGALLPADTEVKAEKVSARVYRHDALGARVVINLVPDPIGEADDLALQTLDFELADVRGPVALGRPRGLGFPASAILADPANARYALDVVKEMERFGRMAKSKPGNAKDGFEAIAARLARSVPHFLPSFHEQAGRFFLDAGAPAQAATQFGKAREVERTYALPVDEAQRRQSFLEFALNGALSAKSMAEYAHELAASQAPAQAHESFKELCLQRTLGGLPPWANMATELRRTAKAAGLNVENEEADLLRQLLEAPATGKAAAGFWSGYRSVLVKMAKQEPAVRGNLLNLHPAPTDGSAEEFTDWWLALLEDCGAFDALVHPEESPVAAGPHGGSGAWLERTVQQAKSGYSWRQSTAKISRLASLLPTIAPAIKATGRPVQLWVRNGVEVDILDCALEAGIDVALPVHDGPWTPQIDLTRYVHRVERRPLLALGAAPEFAELLDRAVASAITSQPNKLVELPGLHEPIRRWLRRQAERSKGGTLLTMSDALAEIEKGATAAVCALDPAAAREIASVDVAAALARTLRGGLLAEFAWPALDKPPVDLASAAVVGFAWPAVIISDQRRAAVVGHAETILAHDLRIPPKVANWGKARLIEANHQLFVGWRYPSPQGYWSGRPGELFEPNSDLLESDGTLSGLGGVSLELSDGARFEGGAPIHAGDKKAAAPRKIVSDSVTTWVLSDTGKSLKEVDPLTGRTGRSSLPSFFEEFASDGWELDLRASWLMPLPAGADASLIGTKNGLIGYRVRRRMVDGSTEWEIEGIDGRRFHGRLGRGPEGTANNPTNTQPVALIAMPGDARFRPLSRYAGANGMILWDADGVFPLVRVSHGTTSKPAGRGGIPGGFPYGNHGDFNQLVEGMAFIPPALYWFVLRPRQSAGSVTLRAVDDATARRLLDAAAKDSAPDAVARAFPAITDGHLRDGVVGAASMAARMSVRLGSLQKAPGTIDRAANSAIDITQKALARASAASGATPAPTVAKVVDDGVLRSALLGLLPESGYWYGNAGRPLEQLATVASVMDGRTQLRKGLASLFSKPEAAKVTIPESRIHWFSVIGRLGAVGLRASLSTTSAEDRETLLAFLRALVSNGYLSRAGQFRLLTVTHKDNPNSDSRLIWTATDTWFLKSSNSYTPGARPFSGIQYSRIGAFGLPKDLSLVRDERRAKGWGDDKSIGRLAANLERRGPIAWDPAAVACIQERTGLSWAASSLLLAGLPNLDSTEHNFLDAQTREILGIKLTEANAARGQLKALTGAERLAILDYAMPLNPDDLWDKGLVPVAERMAYVWVQMHGRTVAMDDETLAQAARFLAIPGGPKDPLSLLVNPSDPRVTKEPQVVVQPKWSYGRAPQDVISAETLRTVAMAIPWAHSTLPVGHPANQAIPNALANLRQRLQSQTLVLPLHTLQWPGCATALSAMGARPWHGPRGATVEGSPLEIGPIVAVPMAQGDFVKLYLRTALAGQPVPAGIASMLGGVALMQTAAFLLGGGSEAIALRASRSPVPVGGFEADPAKSAPEVVAAASASLGMPESSAQLFLQILALPAPAKAQVLKWNGWTPSEWTRAAKPLIDAGILVTGQRARSGREIFLKGPWIEISAPDLPVEAWKLPFYNAGLNSDGSLRKPLDRLVPLVPLHQLFALAWQRWQAGDLPGFEEPPSRAGRR